ncbi:MAG: nucleotide sugar dehydrogenase [Nanoarchaeota archaeon]|nr:nucleotide sugar dehydrogenase [Nanoarchaeota archaeon]
MNTVSVVGLGKIGLPLAVQCANKGKIVIGCDVQKSIVEGINAGNNHVPEEPGLTEPVKRYVKAGKLSATLDTPAAVARSEVVIVVVPLIVDAQKRPDFRMIDSATEAVGRGLQKGALVIFETTLPVGTTRTRLAQKLCSVSGLALSQFFLAFSPERVYSGRILKDLATYPKVVGGVDVESTKRAVAFYSSILDTPIIPLTSDEAEFTKLIDMTYRDVNIALANEFAKFASEKGLDVLRCIEASNSQPYSKILQPGIGVGGHCAPVYPYFLTTQSPSLKLAELARAENDGMAEYLVRHLEEAVPLKGKNVLIAGLAYRANVKETAFTTTKLILEALKKRHAEVFIIDPLFSDDEIRAFGASPSHQADLETQRFDALITQAVHSGITFPWKKLAKNGLAAVLDGRNELDIREITSAGVAYFGAGKLPGK